MWLFIYFLQEYLRQEKITLGGAAIQREEIMLVLPVTPLAYG